MVTAAGNLPDYAAIRADLEFMTAGWDVLPRGTYFELRAFAEDGIPYWDQFTPSRIAEAVAWAAEQNAQGRNVYAVRNPIRADHRGSANDASIIAAFLCWADCDDRASTDNVRRFEGPRWNAAVTTGRTPDPRVHLYWRLTQPTADLAAWRATQSAIAAHLGSDRTVVNPSRIMRVGGTISYPAAHKRERGYVSEVCTLRTVYEDERPPVELERLARVFGAQPASAAERPQDGGLHIDTGGDYGPALDRAMAAASIQSGNHWRDNVKSLVCSYVARGWTDDEIIARCDAFTLAGYTVAETRKDVAAFVKWAREQEVAKGGRYGASPEHTADAPAAARPDVPAEITASPISADDLDCIAPRPWLYGRKLVRGFVSVLASPGGTGKSAWVTAAACDMAAGVSTLNDKPHAALRVWLYNLEDPRDETLRKVAAVLRLKRYREPVLPNLFVNSGREQRLILAEEPQPRLIVARPDVAAIIEEIRARQIDVLTVDPFVRSHLLGENDNKAIDFVMDLYAQIASEANCAVLLVHHTRKGFVSGETDSIRGGSAMTSAARVALTMQTMTPDEAKVMSIPEAERRSLVRIDNAKANLAPPSADAEWVRLVSQPLDNGTDEYPDGDFVQVVTPWTPPDAWDGIGETKANEILDLIAYGFTTESGATEKYSSRPQDDRWAGNAIMAAFPDGRKSHDQCKRILKTWLDSGVLAEVEYQSPTQRKTRRGLEVQQRPGAEE